MPINQSMDDLTSKYVINTRKPLKDYEPFLMNPLNNLLEPMILHKNTNGFQKLCVYKIATK